MKELFDDSELLNQEADINSLRTAHSLLSINRQKSLTSLEDLANHGSVMAMLYLAHEYKLSAGQDNLIAEKWFKLAYENGSSTALLNLAFLYHRRKSYDQAEKIWKEGVVKQDGPSAYWLALLYLGNPLYFDKRVQAKVLLEKATALGQLRAKHRLGLLLIKGQYGVLGIPRGLLLLLEFAISGFKIAYSKPNDRRLW